MASVRVGVAAPCCLFVTCMYSMTFVVHTVVCDTMWHIVLELHTQQEERNDAQSDSD